MNRAERAALREALVNWKAKMTVEMNVGRLRALLDECDRLEEMTEAHVRMLDGYIARCGT